MNPAAKHSLISRIFSLLKIQKQKNTNKNGYIITEIPVCQQAAELLFLSLFLRLLKVGGRCVSIVPQGVMNNTNEKAYTTLRTKLIEDQKLEAVIFMPSGVFEPYSGVSTGILIFTKTNSGGTDKVWMYNMEADGYTLDKKRSESKNNDISDIINRFNNLDKELNRTRTDKSFLVDKSEIVKNKYVLSFNLYHQNKQTIKTYRSSNEILGDIDLLRQQEIEIDKELRKLLKKKDAR